MTPTTDIPKGYCQCGCGGRTRIAPQTHRKLGWTRGEPLRFIRGHGRRKPGRPYEVSDTGCWEWKSARPGWYGYACVEGRTVSAHRLFYELHVGPLLPGHHIHHRCGNTCCVNPEHLEQLTPKQHSWLRRDARLSFEKAEQIRAEHEAGVPKQELADRFGVSWASVHYVIADKKWVAD